MGNSGWEYTSRSSAKVESVTTSLVHEECCCDECVEPDDPGNLCPTFDGNCSLCWDHGCEWCHECDECKLNSDMEIDKWPNA